MKDCKLKTADSFNFFGDSSYWNLETVLELKKLIKEIKTKDVPACSSNKLKLICMNSTNGILDFINPKIIKKEARIKVKIDTVDYNVYSSITLEFFKINSEKKYTVEFSLKEQDVFALLLQKELLKIHGELK